MILHPVKRPDADVLFAIDYLLVDLIGDYHDLVVDCDIPDLFEEFSVKYATRRVSRTIYNY